MKTLARISMACWALSILLVVVPVLAKHKIAPPPPDYFPLRVNDWWKYRWTSGQKSDEYTMKVVKTEETANHEILYVMESKTSTQAFEDWYSKPRGWVEIHKTLYEKNNMSADFTPVKMYLENPLSVDPPSTWEWKGTGMMGVPIEEKNKVTGVETVMVPAGKFSAVRVETDVNQGGTEVKKIEWFANWIGLVKSQTSTNGIDSTMELVDYSFKPKK